MSGLSFTLLLVPITMSLLEGLLTSGMGFETLSMDETWRGRVREGRYSVEVFIKRLGKELQFFLPDSSVPKEICEKVVKRLSAKIYSLLYQEAFNPDYVRITGSVPSFCHYCLESVYMPFRCHRCGGYYCSGHRLPEKHNCPGGEAAMISVSPLVEIDDEIPEKPKKTIIVKEVPCG